MTFHAPIAVRAAVPDDAPFLARMIDIAGEGIPTWLWSQSAGPQEHSLDVGEARARRTAGGFSYLNAHVAELAGKPAGMMLGYVIDGPTDDDRAGVAALPAPVRPFVELEHEVPGTFYVNALAVRPGLRGRGIGTRLMRAAEDGAKAAGADALSIQVFSQNTDALRLYERLGYRRVAARPVLDHPCQPYYDADVLLMTRAIGPA
jgi:ribosomal protein S18 acetylase RimI-like enzyme